LATYSFLDVNAALTDPAGSFLLSEGGVAEEGITITLDSDKGTHVWGADGTPMASLHAAQGGTVQVRLQKTSPKNALLSSLYNQTTASSANFGNTTITIRNPMRGDAILCVQCFIKKLPDNINARDAGMMDWTFSAGIIDEILGDGNPISTTILAG
jgi:hypothetical protein